MAASKDVVFLQNQLQQARREVNNLRQQLSTLNYIHQKKITEINEKLETWQCPQCRENEAVERGEETSSQKNDKETLCLKPIGIINTHFPEKRCTPRQPGVCSEMLAKITLNKDIFTNPSHALEGLQEFSHMWVLFHFHRNDSNHSRAKVSVPRLNGAKTGVYATRSPHRPCPIGLSLVKIDRVINDVIFFFGVDMVDGTPVLDLKPFIPQYDNPSMQELDHEDLSDQFVPNIEEDRSIDETDEPDGVSSNNSSDLGGSDPVMISNSGNADVAIDSDIINRTLEGEENLDSSTVIEISGHSRLDESFNGRSSTRMGEREAPDGEEEEREEPPGTTQTGSLDVSTDGRPLETSNTSSLPVAPRSQGHVRVPSWINRPAVSRLTVTFKDRALAQLLELGPEGEEKKITITNVLREDPRSVYLRERWGSHCYVFRIADLCVSCKFNDDTHTVTVYQIFQNDGQTEGDT